MSAGPTRSMMIGHAWPFEAVDKPIGWPVDHGTEDTFCLPPMSPINAAIGHAFNLVNPPTIAPPPPPAPEDREYRAEYGSDGSARLVIDTVRVIAKFDTFADACTAAEALNAHHGY